MAKVHLKVWTSDFAECETFVFPCHASVEKELVSRFVDELKVKFPGDTFRTVPVGKGRYNLIPQPVANA